MTDSTTRVWPTGTDYARAIQMPSAAFEDPTLRSGVTGTNAMGMPLVASGQNAVVFLIEAEGTKHAVRCFLIPPHEGALRYEGLERHLQNTSPRALTSARWLQSGVTVGGNPWPVVVMPWVEGLPLNLAVEEMIDSPARLLELADRWGDVVRSLQRAGVAHGDLQHGNVMVRPNGSFALVDLDGVWVPEIEVGPPAEFGHPNYQHRDRATRHWGRYVDSFPGALIQLALQALAGDPSLERFLNGENLLFTRADLTDPGSSEIWSTLCASSDAAVAAMAMKLRTRCLRPIDEALVPFDELLLGDVAEVIPLPPPTTPVASGADTAPASTGQAADSAWWDTSNEPAQVSSMAVADVEAAAATPGRKMFALGRNTVVAGLVGGALAGVIGARSTTLFDAALSEKGETIAFVVLISFFLGAFLRGTQMLLARNFVAAGLHMLIGGVVGGGSGVLAIPIADLAVRAASHRSEISAAAGAIVVGTHGQTAAPVVTELTTVTSPMVSIAVFAIVAGVVGFALGLLRSARTGVMTLAAGVVGGAIGGALFGSTVAEYRHGYLDVSFLQGGTTAIVALVGASIGLTYGLAIQVRRSATLTIIEGRNSGLEVSVEGRRITIGSKASCDLVLKGDPRYLPLHAALAVDASGVSVEEAPGAVLRNGTRLQPGDPVASGDVLLVGPSYVRFEMKGVS